VTITWLDNTAIKRSEVPLYEKALTEEKDPREKVHFDKVHEATSNTIGLVIIDVDDPELVEFGEAYIHEQLTSHLADMAAAPKESWPAWFRDTVFPYCAKPMVENIANGFPMGPLFAEMFRQYVGHPYEWYGAPIDD
jgi:hypothetical protein